MKNFEQRGESVTLTAPADVSSGAGVLVGDIFGIAQHDALTGEPVSLQRTGVFEMAKTSAQAWTVGAKVYWDAATGRVTTTAASNKIIGAAAAAAANPSAAGLVLLDGVIR